MLTAEQIQLVQESWDHLGPVADQAAGMFYRRLFELDPELEALFTGDMNKQGKMLMSTLSMAVGSLTDLDKLVPALQSLGVKHVSYNVKPEHYETVGEALLWTLEQGLGNRWSEQVKDAWAATYGLVATTMKEAAYTQPVSHA